MENQNKPIIVETEAGKTYYWCSCHESKNFPFCDGSHAGSGSVPVAQTITESGKVAICACGKSDIFCNGAHKSITE